MPFEVFENILSWFVSALRSNKNNVSHYLDDMTGQGIHLETLSRKFFFQIIKAIVKRLKNIKASSLTNKREIKVLLNALVWNYTARDHEELSDLGLLSILHNGSNDKDNIIKKLWGRSIYSECSTIDDQQLNSVIIESFEQLFLTVTNRVANEDLSQARKDTQGQSGF